MTATPEDTAKWHNRLGALFYENRKYTSAEKHYHKALELMPNHTKFLFNLAIVKVSLGQRKEAIELLEKALENDQSFVEAHVNIAAQSMILGKLELALDHCNTALELDSNHRQAHYNMNVLLRRLNRQQEVIDLYWKRIEADVGFPIRPQRSTNQSMNNELSLAQIEFVTVICVKWGIKYDAEYVNKLYRGILRHSGKIPCRFLCLTEDPIGLSNEIKTFPLEQGWKGWWNKAQVFSPNICHLLSDRCVYIDLDSVIVGEMNNFLSKFPTSFATLSTNEMANEQRKNGFNSSIMTWTKTADLSFLYVLLKKHFDIISKYIYKFDHWLEMAIPCADYLESYFPGQIVEYKSLVEKKCELPEEARIICFPLEPKPHNAKASWILQHWT